MGVCVSVNQNHTMDGCPFVSVNQNHTMDGCLCVSVNQENQPMIGCVRACEAGEMLSLGVAV